MNNYYTHLVTFYEDDIGLSVQFFQIFFAVPKVYIFASLNAREYRIRAGGGGLNTRLGDFLGETQ
jgi:hypothetical protein